jgi:hypothetical protein
MWATPGKWTCPNCGRTFTAYGTDRDVATAIEVVQTAHGKEHYAAAVNRAKLRKTSVDNPAPVWGVA